ncbi:golgin subfamily A member 6-like protein 7 [Leptopilina heterotoma]|uniref:golgin subfamily A member 6-like protein 7 n=1 Tax=Leptopilina heterotoma TaxID=63436 RepID=UPI001CA85C49|nr:golgin subfamily A member 6-like protein 7 [Leptopilina heterotoma]
MADTHCHKHSEPTFDPFPSSNCKSNVKIGEQGCSSKLEDAVKRFAERRVDLSEHERYLKDKVSTMERSIPALMAFNMWRAGEKCKDPPLCKIREIMNKFSPYPDPTESLLENLRTTVQDINREISELHERIIAADVDLEEKGMQLESLELSNNEMGSELKTLEKEISDKSTLSLHSIHSEDLICLSRIRQLGEEERSLKCCIRQLEEKEMAYRQQMEMLLISKDFQNSHGASQMTNRLQELEMSEKKLRCSYQTQKYNMHQMKKKIIEKSEKIAKLKKQSGMIQETGEENYPLEENKEGKKNECTKVLKEQQWTSWTKNNRNNHSCRLTGQSCCVYHPKKANLKKKSCRCSADSKSGYPSQNSSSLRNNLCAENPLCQLETAGRSDCQSSSKEKYVRENLKNLCKCDVELENDYNSEMKKRDFQNCNESSSDDEFHECV